ncbi:MAG: DMT family transporter [Chloroflexales bacterium]|nr:DMT family transporter [Chloroflexales bacterium]
MSRGFPPYVILFSGVLIASTASILIRVAQQEGMSSLGIAAGRLGMAALILAPIAWSQAGNELRSLDRRAILLGMGSGVFLALHFASWISSLAYTSVASSAALVSTNPLWVGIASLLIFRERLSLATISGIGFTLLGAILIAVSDSSSEAATQHTAPLLGNSLALLGALTGTGYFLIGRDLRRRLSLLAYIWLVYTSAAVVLGVWAWLSGQPLLGYSPLAYLCVLGLAIGPQLLGHTAFNWSLRYLSATFVTVAILGEPVGSALLALAFFREWFAPLQLLGFVILLFGIAIASVGESRSKTA